MRKRLTEEETKMYLHQIIREIFKYVLRQLLSFQHHYKNRLLHYY